MAEQTKTNIYRSSNLTKSKSKEYSECSVSNTYHPTPRDPPNNVSM